MELLLFLSFVSFFSEVLSDYCGEDKFCHSPYKCCESRKECCYDSMLHSNQLFRLQIWNMWYFWLLVIFMLMSCFGGCGYYRRRRLALMSRSSSLTRPDTILPAPCHSSTRRSRNQEGSRQFNFFAYNGPGFNGPEPVSNLPPAYYEVVNQPNLYPVNKAELPPYPGFSKNDDSENIFPSQGSAMGPPLQANLPPPYTEFQYSSSLPATSLNQNNGSHESGSASQAFIPPVSAASYVRDHSLEENN
ncbi:proline-rich protein 2 isoform X1 [Biomphalaria glabrata]|uniref:WW domain binding protein VOPP1 n=1 Tax=Biomphalaria glabrata TaxID=6526 RepID=A0A9W2ZJK1_BIOGL|nr:uncharacterized protein LOC106056639 isoform X2 [Biomphalaria glabrata]KAI8756044.1 proline-rich protein 2 isoform X1 [Biomphalaria glabrata]KAI8793576.1 proline-rich protein 2 isoform X1 [Biomphalaria glabrata]